MPQEKINNFAFKNSNIIIEGIINWRRDNFTKKKFLKHRKIILSINFISAQTFFHIGSSQISKNDGIRLNHGSSFQAIDSLQLDSSPFPKTNSLMTETIKK